MDKYNYHSPHLGRAQHQKKKKKKKRKKGQDVKTFVKFLVPRSRYLYPIFWVKFFGPVRVKYMSFVVRYVYFRIGYMPLRITLLPK